MNRLAWQQLTDSDLAKRRPAAAVTEAEQAVSAQPENASFLTTLGVARYRTGDYSAAIENLERSIKLGDFDAHNGFFLAAAHAQIGQSEQARKLFSEADRWMRANKPNDNELTRFREEAAAVLYLTSVSAGKDNGEK
jgi:eukaryotic-like serine/threonine-protein kinase